MTSEVLIKSRLQELIGLNVTINYFVANNNNKEIRTEFTGILIFKAWADDYSVCGLDISDNDVHFGVEQVKNIIYNITGVTIILV